MLQDNPVLAMLGRRGRGAVVEALRRAPGRTWGVRDLARAADVPPTVASRAVRELAALGAVAAKRPGRDARVRFEPASRVGAFLAALQAPSPADEATDTFAGAFRGPRGATLVHWREPADDPADPAAPARVAALVASEAQEEQAWEAAGAALDAVRAAGLPQPQFTVWRRSTLGDDATGLALLAGRVLAR